MRQNSILTRIEAAETDLTPYDLIREVVAQTEDFQHAILLSITLRQADLDAGIRALWRGIQIHDFVDLFETLRDPSDTHRKASLGEFPTQQAHDHQGKHAIKSVDSEFLVGPMMARTKRKESRVFHATKCCFDVGLAPVGKDNLFVGPLIAVAEKHGFAEKRAIQFLPLFVAKGPLEPGNLILSHFNFGGEELLHVTSREDALQTVPSSLQGRLLSPGDLIDMPLQHRLKFVEFATALGNFPPQGFDLSPVELTVVGDKDGATDTEDLLSGSVTPNRRQLGFVEAPHFIPADAQQLGMLSGHQRSNEMEWPIPYRSEVFLGVISFVEDERDVTNALRKLPAAVCQFVGHAGKCYAVGLVSGIGTVKQGHIAIRGHHQGQADNAQTVSAFLAVAPLRQIRTIVEAVNEGEEVRGVKQQASEIEAEPGDRRRRDLLLDIGDRHLAHPIHVVPKALAGQLRALQAKQPGQHGFVIPFADLRLAAWRHATIDTGNQEILPNRGSLVAQLGNMLVYNRHDLQLLGEVESGGRGTELTDDDFGGLGIGDPEGECLRSTDVLLPHNFGVSVNPSALTEVVIGSSLDEFLGQAWHG